MDALNRVVLLFGWIMISVIAFVVGIYISGFLVAIATKKKKRH